MTERKPTESAGRPGARRRRRSRRTEADNPTTFAEAAAYRDTAEALLTMGKKRQEPVSTHVQGRDRRSKLSAEARRLKRCRPAALSTREFMRSMARGGTAAAVEWLQNKGVSLSPQS
jgi:hypothetical protein